MKKGFIIFGLLAVGTVFGYYVMTQSSQCEAKAGCCSRHGGVSHCGKSGYYVCNDGAVSPSCQCSN